MAKIAKTVRVFDQKCLGCEKTDTYIMVSFQTEVAGEITDLCIPKQLAKFMYREMRQCMERNSELDNAKSQESETN